MFGILADVDPTLKGIAVPMVHRRMVVPIVPVDGRGTGMIQETCARRRPWHMRPLSPVHRLHLTT
jgi:hypothetical protein